MRSFLIKLSRFTLVPIGLLLIYYGIGRIQVTRSIQEMGEKYSVILMGDSQIQRINPIAFPGQTLNFGSSGEPYFVSYAKLQKLLGVSECSVQTIILGVSPHNFSPAYQRLCNSETPEGQRILTGSLYFMDLSEDTGFHLPGILFNAAFPEALFKKVSWGGLFESDYESPADSVIQKSLEMFETRNIPFDGSHQRRYLEKIIAFCGDKDIRLIVLSTPVHPDFQEQIPGKYLSEMAQAVKMHPGLEQLDLREVTLGPEFFSDGNHLNKQGAAIVSKKIANYLEKTSQTP